MSGAPWIESRVDYVGTRVIFGISDDLYPSTMRSYEIAFRYAFWRVIGSLGMNVRMYVTDDAADIELRENDDGVDRGKSG